MTRSLTLATLALAIASNGASATAGEITFRSGPKQVALIELYTSEGCSSCPPAEKWLGDQRIEAGLWRDFVPVAFHVNYWDHLGWRDILAAEPFTRRQHAYAQLWHTDSVYTPCFVRNGAEWRPGERARSDKARTDAAELELAWQGDSNSAIIRFMPPSGEMPKRGFDANIALLGGGIVSHVRKGENAGRELRHEFVALRLVSPPLSRQADGTWRAVVHLPPRTDVTTARRAIAAWITPRGELAPVQATGGWLTESDAADGPSAAPH